MNALLPGSGLVLQGRLLAGLLLLLPAVALLGLMVLAAGLADEAYWRQLLLQIGGSYVLLSGIAAGLLWWSCRRPAVDTEQARALVDASAHAYLNDRHSEAIAQAQALCRQAPHLPGAWQLLALVAQAAGQPALVKQAERRRQRLLDQL